MNFTSLLSKSYESYFWNHSVDNCKGREKSNQVIVPISHKVFRTLLLTVLLSISFSSQAQYPTGFYGFSNSTGTFNLLSGATSVTATNSSNDDGISAAQNIGFTFNFSGVDYTQFLMNTNGWITFTTSATATTNYSSLNATVNNVIAVYSGDLTSAGGAMSYLVTGSAGTRICMIEWKDTKEFSSTEVPDVSNFQVWLYEGSNKIEVRYGSFSVGSRTAAQAPQPQVGLHGTSTSADQIASLSGSWASPTVGNSSASTMTATTTSLPDNGRIYTFTTPVACTTPSDQPTSLTLKAASNDKFNGSFTAASSNPDGYLIVRYPAGASITNPSDATTYTTGNTIGAGTVVIAGSSTSFLATGLSPVTAYDFYIYSMNNRCLNGPKYLPTSPLKGTGTTNLLASTADNYLFGNSTGSTLDPMTGATNLIGSSVDDTPSPSSTNIGFDFAFEEIIYTNFWVTPDGFLKLGGSSAASAFTNGIGSTTIANSPLLCPHWDDMATGIGGNVSYVVTGSSPNRILKVQWFVTIPRVLTANANSTFQVWLYETSNKIEFRYGNMGPGTTSASVGIRGLTLSPAKFISISLSPLSLSNILANDANAVQPLNGHLYSFDPPASCSGSPTTQPTSLSLSPVTGTSSQIRGSFTAATGNPNSYLVVSYPKGASPTSPVNGTYYYRGNTLGAGTVISLGMTRDFLAQDLKDTSDFDFYVYSASICLGGPLYNSTSPLKGTGTTYSIVNYISTSTGGLWSRPETWKGGIIPFYTENAIIADGATVTNDMGFIVKNLIIGQGSSGVLQWNATTNAVTVLNDILINPGAMFLPYTTGSVGQTINIGGNFTNNGYTNCAVASTLLNFNGSQIGGSMNQILGGNGTFQGDGTKGIIRALFFQTTGSSEINTSQDIITSSFAATAGSVNTNGKLTIDNTAQVYGQQLNLQVASVAVTNMGVAYTNAPVVFGATSSPWTASGTGTSDVRYFSGNNVYLATTSGTFDASTAPTHTSGIVTNGSVDLLWLGAAGTLGNPFQKTSAVLGTQYFYGDYLYVCTAAGTPSATAPPTHTSGTASSGSATFLYVGNPAIVSVNYNSTTQTVRSLTLISAGSGYSSVPSLTFNTNGGTVTTVATASVVFFQQIIGPANSLTQKSGSASISGGLNINSTQGAAYQSGVGAISTTNGGVYYTAAPTVGFTGPTGINLVTNPGSGYTTNPTISLSGGTLVSGTALTTSSFTIVVNRGQVISVYLSTPGTACYSVPPTLSFSSGSATLGFPSGCWPAATASIGSNGQLTSFTVTSPGYGYVTAPTVGIGTTSGTSTGGTFSTVATTPTCRVALYNVTYNNFTPSPTVLANTEGAEIPNNRRINNLTLAAPGIGAKFFSNLELSGTAPLTLTSGVLDMGGSNLLCSWNGYAGTTGSLAAHIKNASMTIVTRGGGTTGSTLNFPFDATFGCFTGSGTAATGASVLTVTATQTTKPSGGATGKRAYRAVVNSGAVYGTNPTVTLNWNAVDSLVSDQAGLYVAQATLLSGSWTTRSLTSGTVNGSLAVTGSRTTSTASPGPIVPTGDDYYAWVTTYSPPSPLSFDITRSTGISYSSIMSSGNTLGWTGTSTDEQVSPNISIPSSTFTYQGQTVTGISVSTNGFLKLNTASSGAITAANLTNVFGGAPVPLVVAPFWEDLTTNPNSALQAKLDSSNRYQIIGSTPGSRQIVCEWFNYKPFSGSGAKLNFQVVLDETDNSIAFNYGQIQGFNSTGNFAYSYSCGLGGLLINGNPLPGQVLAMQYENSTAFSNTHSQTGNFGANGLRILPEANSSIKFTPGTYAGFSPPSQNPPANDNSGGAITIATATSLPANLSGTFYSSRFATPSSNSVCSGIADDDVWFKFKASQKNTIVRVHGSAGFIPRVEVLNSGFNSLSPSQCVVGAAAGSSVDVNLTGLTSGQIYYIRVYHELGGVVATGTANISSAGVVTSVTMTNFGSGYVSATTGSILTSRVRFTGGGGTDAIGTAVLTGSSVAGISINSGGYGYTSPPTFTIEDPAWSLTGEFSIVVISKSENDDCITATNLTGLSTPGCNNGTNSLTDNTVSATASSQSAICGTPDDDVWYKFTAVNANSKIKVSGTGSFDPAFQVFDGGAAPGNCGTLSSLQCINTTGAGSTDSTLVSTTIGNTYFVRVYHAGTGTAADETFTICVTSAIPDCISAPTAPTNSSLICEGNVTLKWPTAPIATAYDVYLDAGSGPASTLVASNLPGTSFTMAISATNYSWRVVPKNIFGNASSCSDFTFVAAPLPKPSFTYADTCGGGTVNFSSTSTVPGGSISSNAWKFGDGTLGSGNTTSHTYATAGASYNVKVISTSNLGCTDSASKSIFILSNLVAGAISADQTICFNTTPSLLTGNTSASGSKAPYVYQWQQSTDNVNFTNISGAGSIDYQPGALSTTTYYRRAVSTTSGCGPAYTNTVKITVNAILSAGVIGSAQTICSGGTGSALTFSSNPTGAFGTYTYQWQQSPDSSTWSNISGQTSTSFTPTNVTSVTYYRVLVTSGSCPSAGTNGVKIKLYSPITGGSIAAGQTICAGTAPAAFTQVSAPTGGPGTYNFQWQSSTDSINWNNISGANASTYTSGAISSLTYFQRLASSTGCPSGTSNALKVRTLPKPNVVFSVTNHCYNDAMPVTNTSNISSGSLSYLWKFGDGTTSTSSVPNKTYSSSGTYNVTLIATSNLSCKDSGVKSVIVATTPTPNYSFALKCQGDSVIFTDQTVYACGASSGLVYLWNFGDGTTSNVQHARKHYNAAGTYNVKFKISLPGGYKDSITKTVVFNIRSTPAFSATNTCYPAATTFTNSSTNSASVLWSFGDGTTSTSSASSFSKTYGSAATYNAKLVSTSSFGCKDSIVKQVFVFSKPTAGFSTANNCVGNSTSFTNTSSGASTYLWDFGNATTSTNVNPSLTYGSAGTYTVKLKVTSVNGCVDSVSSTVTVYPNPTAAFTTSNVCLGFTSVFTNTSTGASSYKWDFGNGNSSTSTSPSYSYPTAGNYTVTLTATTSNGCSKSVSSSYTVNGSPTAGFTGANVCIGTSINFTNTSSGAVLNNWTFGDGTTSTQASPSKAYASSGNFNVKLSITNSFGCKDSITKSVTIFAKPVAGFSATNQCFGNAISFTNQSSGNATNLWAFGDGNSSAASSPNYNYASAGTYNVKLGVATTNGCRDSITKSITVYPKPSVSFTATPNPICRGGLMSFNNTTTNGSSYLWTFGNGATSTATNPTNIYNTAGNYNVKLVSTSTNGCKDSAFRTVTIWPRPVASFKVNDGCETDNLAFSSNSVGAVSHAWTFGDATTSSATNPSKAYSAAGTYSIRLIVTSINGCLDTTNSTVSVHPRAKVSFTNASSFCVGASAAFTNTSTLASGSMTFQWNFGDGNSSSSTNATNVYGLAGNYTVTLSASTDKGCVNTATTSVLVYAKPTANFNAASMCQGQSVSFNNSSTGATSYSWDFGDAGTSSLAAPSHTYASGGTYDVKLTVTNANGCSDVFTKQLVIYANPVAGFTAADRCIGLAIPFVNTSTGYNDVYWQFGDGNSSNSLNPNYTYNAAGTYNVTLNVESINGCLGSVTKVVTVFPAPKAAFSINNGAQCVNVNNFVYTDNSSISSGSYTRNWSLGDATSSSSANPVKTYGASGAYTVTLVVTSNNGCVSSASANVSVYPKPTANFNINNNSQCLKDNLFAFSDGSSISSGSLNYSWNLGDGTSASGTYTIKKYDAVATFNVTLMVSSDFGCSDNITKAINVNASPSASFTVNDDIQCLNGNVFNFTNTTSGALVSSNWKLGDGTTLSTTNASRTYSTAGNYRVTLNVSTPAGCKDSAYYTTKVLPNPANVTISGLTPAPLGSNQLYSVPFSAGSSYNWVATNGTIASNGASTVQVKWNKTGSTGSLSVIQTGANGCLGNPANYAVTLYDATSVANINRNAFAARVYPNPAKNQFSVEVSTGEMVTMVIYDQLGRQILQSAEFNNLISFENQHLAAGIYNIHLTAKSGKTSNLRFEVVN